MSNILKKVQEIKRSKKRQEEQKEKEYQKSRREESQKENYAVKAIEKEIMQLDGKRRLHVHLDENRPGIFGEIGTIVRRKGNNEWYIGTVCLQTHTFMMHYSDDSPEQETSDTRICLREVVNGDGRDLVSAHLNYDGCGWSHKKAVKKMVNEFGDELASYLAEKVF